MNRKLYVCGHGVFVTTAAGGMEPRPAWRDSIDALCEAVVRATGPGALVRYGSYPETRLPNQFTPRGAMLDVTGSLGSVFISLSISPHADPADIDARDLPRLRIDEVGPGSELEFWLANELDALCLAARLLAALDQGASVAVVSSLGPSTSARCLK